VYIAISPYTDHVFVKNVYGFIIKTLSNRIENQSVKLVAHLGEEASISEIKNIDTLLTGMKKAMRTRYTGTTDVAFNDLLVSEIKKEEKVVLLLIQTYYTTYNSGYLETDLAEIPLKLVLQNDYNIPESVKDSVLMIPPAIKYDTTEDPETKKMESEIIKELSDLFGITDNDTVRVIMDPSDNHQLHVGNNYFLIDSKYTGRIIFDGIEIQVSSDDQRKPIKEIDPSVLVHAVSSMVDFPEFRSKIAVDLLANICLSTLPILDRILGESVLDKLYNRAFNILKRCGGEDRLNEMIEYVSKKSLDGYSIKLKKMIYDNASNIDKLITPSEKDDKLLSKLKHIIEGDSSQELDNSIEFFSSEVSPGRRDPGAWLLWCPSSPPRRSARPAGPRRCGRAHPGRQARRPG